MVNDLLERIGVDMNNQGMRQAFLRKLITSAMLVVTIVTVTATLITMEIAPLHVKIAAGISFCYPVVIMFVADMTFVVSVSVIGRKYQILNETLRCMLTDEPDAPRHRCLVNHLVNDESKLRLHAISYTVNDATILIKLIKEVHLQLLKLCEQVNNTYGLQILLSIVVAFGVITGNIYVSYKLLQDGYVKRHLAFKSMTNSIVWTLYYAIKISNFIEACSRCKQHAVETGDLLNKFYDDPFADEQVQSEIRDFNVQLIQRPVQFTAAGCIALDTRLLQIMVSSITTYLMILIEIEKGLT